LVGVTKAQQRILELQQEISEILHKIPNPRLLLSLTDYIMQRNT